MALLLCGLYSCSKYDDGPLTRRVEGIEGRVSKLEQTCSKLNQELTALQNIVTRLQNNDYVTAVAPLMEQGKQVGYTLTFAKSNPIQIRDGKNGKDGVDGKNGHTPVISIKADNNGVYYWTIDGKWLLNAEGEKVKAEGKDGADGKDGVDGQPGADGKKGADGVTPQLKIEGGYWYVSSDKGASWQKLGLADGTSYVSPIKEVKVEETQIVLTLSTGEVMTVPRSNPKALTIKAPDSMEIDFGFSNSVSLSYTIVNGTAPTLVQVEVSKGLKATLQESSNGLGGTITLEVISSTETKGLVVIKVFDAKGKEAIKVVSLTQKPGDPQDPSSTISDDPNPIAFKDATVKRLLLKLCDSNGDRKISYAEASRVKALPEGVFDNNANIKSFDELQYFTSLESIPKGAFQSCKNLKSVVVPKGVSTIGANAFDGCSSLTSVVIPKGVTTIEWGAFNGCSSLTSVVIPKGVITICEWAFTSCSSLTSVVIPEGVITIGKSAFAGCSSLTSVVIPEGVNTIGGYAFYKCSSLTSVVIPKGVTTIETGAFGACSSLTSVVIPEGVTTIKRAAFSSCSSLTSVVIPEGVTTIDWLAFSGCKNLTKVKLPSTLKEASLKDIPTTAVITVPRGYAAIYRAKFFSDAYTIVEE